MRAFAGAIAIQVGAHAQPVTMVGSVEGGAVEASSFARSGVPEASLEIIDFPDVYAGG